MFKQLRKARNEEPGIQADADLQRFLDNLCKFAFYPDLQKSMAEDGQDLSQAVADRDHIYGVIRGSATNHGGKATGYTVPNPEAHAELIVAAMKRAEVSPDQVLERITRPVGSA